MKDTAIEIDALVIGGGVLGLAVAAQLPERMSTILIERHDRFGCETSSRNSEVVHSGIYYPVESNKTKFCIAGRQRLYEFCETHQIPHAKVGKVVVATSADEEGYLEKLHAHAKQLEVPVSRLTGEEVTGKEPLIKAMSGLFFPETGIVDSHALMGKLEAINWERRVVTAYRHNLESVEPKGGRWLVKCASPDGMIEIAPTFLINAAGLGAAEIANAALGTSRFQHRFCRGRYFVLSEKYRDAFTHLVYPVPPKDGLGVHVTSDIEGAARLGPDVDWCPEMPYRKLTPYYDCDWESLREPFCRATQKYLPKITPEDLTPGQIGVRPKLFLNGQANPDFLIHATNNSIHCLGIESPGLTASLALAEEIVESVF